MGKNWGLGTDGETGRADTFLQSPFNKASTLKITFLFDILGKGEDN